MVTKTRSWWREYEWELARVLRKAGRIQFVPALGPIDWQLLQMIFKMRKFKLDINTTSF